MKIQKTFLLFCLSLILALGCYYLGIFHGLSRTWYDLQMQNALTTKQPRKDIILVTVDAETIKLYGQYSGWSRSRYQGLLEEIEKHAPKVVVFDYFFPSKVKPENVDWDLIERLSGFTTAQVDDLFDRYDRKLKSPHYLSTIDKDFALLMKQYGNVILPFTYRVDEAGKISGNIDTEPFDLYKNVTKIGYANIFPDPDGIVRSLPLNLSGGKSLAQMVTEMYLGKLLDSKPSNILINFFAEPYNFTMVPFQNAYNGIWKDYAGKNINIRNAIVIIGDAHESLGDTHKTPVGKKRVMAGVELLANEIQTLIEDGALHTLITWQYLLIISILTILSFVIFQSLYRLFVNVLVFSTLAVTFILLASKLFVFNIYLDIIPILLAITVPFLMINITRLVASHKEKERVRKIFSRYVDHSVVDAIVDSGSMPTLTGEQKEVTVFFSDVEGFTSMSEVLDPKTLLATLNDFFEIANTAIIANKGTLGKYIGDAIMAYWGAPIKHRDHASLACETILQIQENLVYLNEKHQKKGLPPIHLKYGINTGMATVGNIGSELYSDYTVMGDTVNLASRLEGINKYYHTSILISEATKKQLEKRFIVREIDTIRVKGKQTPIKIYELLGNTEKPELLDLKKRHETGLKAYYQHNWFEALKLFVLNETTHGDPVAQVFIERINSLQQTPPPQDWDGVWNFESK